MGATPSARTASRRPSTGAPASQVEPARSELFEIAGHFEASRLDRMNEIQEIVKSFQFVVAATTVGADTATAGESHLALTLAEEA